METSNGNFTELNKDYLGECSMYVLVKQLKKYIGLLMMVVLIALISSDYCCADLAIPHGTLSPDQMYLGGISCNSSREYVRSIYGVPTRIDGQEYWYGNTFYISFLGSNNHWNVWSVVTTDNNGIATAAGVTVGMDVSILNKLYGKAAVFPQSRDDDVMIYNYHGYGEAIFKEFFFYVRDNKIIKIQLSTYD